MISQPHVPCLLLVLFNVVLRDLVGSLAWIHESDRSISLCMRLQGMEITEGTMQAWRKRLRTTICIIYLKVFNEFSGVRLQSDLESTLVVTSRA